MTKVEHHEDCVSHQDDNYCDCDLSDRLEDEEQVTFAGIPIPLTMETILDAMEWADAKRTTEVMKGLGEFTKCNRQYHAFRDRILRMDAMAKSIISDLNMEINMRDVYNIEVRGLADEKDARIAELEKECAELEDKVGEYQQYWIRQQRR